MKAKTFKGNFDALLEAVGKIYPSAEITGREINDKNFQIRIRATQYIEQCKKDVLTTTAVVNAYPTDTGLKIWAVGKGIIEKTGENTIALVTA